MTLEEKADYLNWVEVAEFIVRKEGRFDASGNLTVYKLPPGDHGGKYEVAGITDKYHPEAFTQLKALLDTKDYGYAFAKACGYIEKYVRHAREYHSDLRVDIFMADLAFNRGPTGARKIAQRALISAGLYPENALDGDWGPLSQEGFDAVAAEELVPRLLVAWTQYERDTYDRDETSPFWPGLLNRRIDALQLALGIGHPYRRFC